MNNIKPIIFSTPMVQAILDGRKSQTRRVIPEKVIDEFCDYNDWCDVAIPPDAPEQSTRTSKYQYYLSRARYEVGDILWVRESWCYKNAQYKNHIGYDYCATCIYDGGKKCRRSKEYFEGKKPSIHMPKAAARIFLRVTGVRAERVQDISIADCISESFDKDAFKQWVKDNYVEPYNNQHWITDKCTRDYDHSLSYCMKCGEKEVARLRREAKNKGFPKADIEENIYLDGGWDAQEGDSPSWCEKCGKMLTFTLLSYESELNHYRAYGFTERDTYALRQMLNDEIEVADISRIFFRSYWDILYGKEPGRSWKDNPWVWAYSFERIDKPDGWPGGEDDKRWIG